MKILLFSICLICILASLILFISNEIGKYVDDMSPFHNTDNNDLSKE